MSGGSYGYLCDKGSGSDVVPLLGVHEEMLAQLVTYGEAGRGARVDLEMLIQLERLAFSLHDRLRDVFHDVEWHVSCDYGEDQVRECLKKYNEARPKWGDA